MEYYNSYSNDYEDWDYGYGEAFHVGNQMMPLENGTTTCTNTHDTIVTVSGKRDPLTGHKCGAPVTTHNRYIMLTETVENETDIEDDDNSSAEPANQKMKKHRLDQRQRRRSRLQTQHAVDPEDAEMMDLCAQLETTNNDNLCAQPETTTNDDQQQTTTTTIIGNGRSAQ